MKTKLVLVSLLLLVALVGVASALPVRIDKVEINDVELSETTQNSIRALDKGKTLDVRVVIASTSNDTLEDVQIEASIRGDDHDGLIDDITRPFDVRPGRTYVETLELTLPIRMDRGEYRLRVRVEDKNGETKQVDYFLEIEGKTHNVVVRDIVTSPSGTVEAGRALLASVRVKNYGTKREDDLKVTVRIPELGVVASDFIDRLDAEDGNRDSTTSEELFLRIPEDAKSGDYTVIAEVEFDDGDSVSSASTSINVIGAPRMTEEQLPPQTGGQTILSIGPESQDVAAGSSAIYPLTITNTGDKSMSYIVSVDGVDFGTASVTPTNVAVVDGGESMTLFIRVTPNDDATGQQAFTVSIKSGGKVLKQVPLMANVKASNEGAMTDASRIKRAFEIGLVVLVVLLVVLGLIIGFNKLRGPENGKGGDEGSQTYY